MSRLVTVCPKKELAPGGVRVLSEGGKEIAVFHAGGGFYALDNACPHRGGPLSDGRLDGTTVACPWHGWQFDVRTGALLMSPENTQKTYPVEIHGEDLCLRLD